MSYETKKIRNVVLLGHSGCGKTTFSETMLFEAGAIARRGRVEDGNTVSDYTNIEKTRGNSIFTSLMNANWRDCKINIVDTPGLDDFAGEVVSALSVTDTAVVIVNGANGVEVGTELLWETIGDYQTPALFVINQLDHSKASYENTLEQMRERFGPNVIPFQYPLNQGGDFNTIVDALRMTMYVFGPDGGKPEKVAIPDSEIGRAQEMHNALVEAAAENDEGLMEQFFEAGSLTEEELAKGLTIALAKQEIFPVFCCSAINNMGSGRIMGFINDIAPSPADRENKALVGGEVLKPDPNDATTLFIYKTISEPKVGNVSYFKVFSGSLKTGDELENAQNRNSERFNQIFVANGKERTLVNELKAGDLGVTVKLKHSHTNNTLFSGSKEKVIRPIRFPAPKIRMAVSTPSKSDIEKMTKALHILQEEDPTIQLEHSRELKQMILHGQGQLHLDIAKYRLEKVYGINLVFEDPRIPYRETITKPADAHYRHKKQSGGSGQFGEVHMRIEPYFEGMPEPEGLTVRSSEIEDLPWGGKFAYYWCIVGGSIDTKFTQAIRKGIMLRMQEGPLTGSPCIDIRVSIYDGKMHPVDSNDMAFQTAGSIAFKQGFELAGSQILEPIYRLEVLCDSEVMGEVMSDLQTRRAIIMGMDTEGHYQKIKAKVPLAELHKYSSSLRSLTQGKAKFSQEFEEYSLVPGDVQQRLMNQYKGEDDS
ncbi:MAG: elongation factor G [Saprospirales bacterium]|nr:MAG: elongation factor G [Saprospirales bacterium]